MVRKCVDSWIKQNPSWKVMVLDARSLPDYIDLAMPDQALRALPLPLQSDLVRMALLAERGGVWADATTYCMKPLDEWIDDYAASVFFAFDTPGADRLMSSWFLASAKGSVLSIRLYDRFRAHLLSNRFKEPNRLQRKIKKVLYKTMNRNVRTTAGWFHPLVTKVFRVYPYFIFHYTFNKLIAEDRECNGIWSRTKRYSADLPHLVGKTGLYAVPTPEIKKRISERDIPLFKLNRKKYDPDRYGENTLLYYLLEGEEG